MTKATKRLSKARAAVIALPNLLPAKRDLFLSILSEITLSSDEEESLGAAIHVSMMTGKDKRLALRGLELATVVDHIIRDRTSLDEPALEAIVKTVQNANKTNSDTAVAAATAGLINSYPDRRVTDELRVYVERHDLPTMRHLSVDLPLPGTEVLIERRHDKSYKRRLPATVLMGGPVRKLPTGKLGFMQFSFIASSQGRLDFPAQDVTGVWTDSVTSCVPVYCLWGGLPMYSAMTFAHVPGGDVSKLKRDELLPADLGIPARVVLMYSQDDCDAQTFDTLDVLLTAGVPRNRVYVYGASGGGNFMCDRYGFFGQLPGSGSPASDPAFHWRG